MSVYNSDLAVVEAIDLLERNGMTLDAIAAAQKTNPDQFRAALAQIAYSASQVERHAQILGETVNCINQLASGVAWDDNACPKRRLPRPEHCRRKPVPDLIRMISRPSGSMRRQSNGWLLMRRRRGGA